MSTKELTMEKLEMHMDFAKDLYDTVRIVEPIDKKVLGFKESEIESSDSNCYGFWERDHHCDNCISMKAHKKQETYLKIEHLNNKIYMILAMPIQIGNRKIVLELLKDIKEEGFFFQNTFTKDTDIYKLLKKRNLNIVKDSISGAYNRRFINERLPYDILKSKILEEPITLIMFDIDDFKDINKTYGHSYGNQVLKGCAQLLESKLDKSDWLARYTADSFAICLKNKNLKEGEEKAEELRKAIGEHSFQYDNQVIKLTASAGVYSVLNSRISLEAFIEAAKLALSIAKDKGKNCVESIKEKEYFYK